MNFTQAVNSFSKVSFVPMLNISFSSKILRFLFSFGLATIVQEYKENDTRFFTLM